MRGLASAFPFPLATFLPFHPAVLVCLAFLILPPLSHADQLQMGNGDVYFGKVVSMSDTNVILQSEVLGKITLPRDKVSSISLGNVSARPLKQVNGAMKKPEGVAAPDLTEEFKKLRTNQMDIAAIKAQYLSQAGPEATQKFDELLNGLMTGKVTLPELQAQARTAADQIRTLRRELGEESGEALDGYLAILDNFVREADKTVITNIAPSANKKPLNKK
jgi:hypothetical protein